MKKLCIIAVISLLNFAAITKAHDFSNSMENGLFFQLGGSYNSVTFDQYLDASGVSNIYSDSVLVAYGEAGGPANPSYSTQSIFAPVVQLGYSRKISENNDWFLGFKLTYKYLGLTFTESGINSPQYGSFTNTQSAPSNTTFTGHVTIDASQTHINNELGLMAFAGYSFADNCSVYLGASPVVLGTQANLYQAVGFADINGAHFDITGAPINFSNAMWMWGGAGEIGINYNFNARWFLNTSYKYVITGTSTLANSSLFASESDGYVDTGTLYTTVKQRVVAQAIAVSISMVF